MRFCDDHWTRLRQEIEERGLTHLIAPDAQTAMAQTKDQLERAVDGRDEVTPVNFDPLMSAHWAIVNNVMATVGSASLYLMSGDDETPEDPIDFGEAPNGQRVAERLREAGIEPTWPRCPLCYIGLAHELSCTESRCKLPAVDGYAWMLRRAAEDAVAQAAALAPGGS